MCRGSPRDKNSEQNLLMEANELRSISNTITSAFGLSFWILSFISPAFFKSLAGMITLTPLLAITLAVSAPMPDVAPSISNPQHQNSTQFSLILEFKNQMKPCTTEEDIIREPMRGKLFRKGQNHSTYCKSVVKRNHY